MWKAFLDLLPRGYGLPEQDWQRRHRLVLWVLSVHIPGLAVLAAALGRGLAEVLLAPVGPLLCLLLGIVLRRHRRAGSVAATAGLVGSSTALVVITHGSIEAHFHFFIIIGFIALYQDWIPFLFNILFTLISHGVGSAFQRTLIFDHPAAQANPWLWSFIHAVAVLIASVGMLLFWRITEESQQEKDALSRELAQTEIGRRQFTSDLLVNLARRNQGMLYRQLDIINQLEESERDPDALAELFKLDHLATRIRRNAESLLVLSGEQPTRTWSEPVPLRDVLRAAVAETEDLDRVVISVDEHLAVAGQTVTDLTHLVAELAENAVRCSPPDTAVTVRTRPDRAAPGGQVLTVEDWGVGMPPDDLAAANTLLAQPPEIDLSVSQRLGFHVVARLAARHDIRVSLTPTPGSGVTAVVVLPAAMFALPAAGPFAAAGRPGPQPGDAVDAGRSGWAARYGPTRNGRHGTPAGGPAIGQRTAVVPAPRPSTGALARAVLEGHIAPPPPRPGPPADQVPERSGWWTDTAVDRGAPPPEPPPPSWQRPTGSPGTRSGDGGTSLRRRVPQASLAPELREPPDGPAGPAGLPGPGRRTADAAEAASALSRYQASRAAAQADVEHGPDATGWRS